MRRILTVGALLLALLLSPFLVKGVLADLAAQQMPLNPAGSAAEMHADSAGNLWISDYYVGEIWQVSAGGASSYVYKVGRNPNGPSDASPDNVGGVWWVDGTNLYRLNLSDNKTQAWAVSNSSYLWGVGPVSATQAWMSDSATGNVYLFTTGTLESCAYALPGSGQGYYVAAAGTMLWIGDVINSRLVRIDSSKPTDNVTYWPLPTSSPNQVAIDASGNIWYTDTGVTSQLGYLALSDKLSLYPLPAGTGLPTQVSMLAAAGNVIWFSGGSPSAVGSLDPTLVAVTPQTASPTTVTVTPKCVKLKDPSPGEVIPDPGTPHWSGQTYTTLAAPAGWMMYGMPPNAQLEGIAVVTSANMGYVVDWYNQVLGKFSVQPPTAPRLTLVKTVVNDNGGTAVVSDFPLFINGQPVTSGSANTLEPYVPYTASETSQAGYAASAWGGDCAADGSITLMPGDDKTCTITNNDIQPILYVIKHVINDNGGTAVASDFPISVLGTNASPSSFAGAESPGTTVHLNAGSFIVGELTAVGYTAGYSGCSGTIAIGETMTCTITNDDKATHLKLVKYVTKDNGGTAAATDWNLTATGTKTYTGAGGFDLDVDPGTYALSESTGPAGYSASAWSCTGGSQSGSNITLAKGQSATCTITNNDIAPALHLHKVVDNAGGGTAQDTDWTLSAAGPTPLSGHTPVDSGANFSAGTYSLSETGPTGYSASAWVCTGGGTQNENQITLALGQSATCTITNTFILTDKPYKVYVPAIRK